MSRPLRMDGRTAHSSAISLRAGSHRSSTGLNGFVPTIDGRAELLESALLKLARALGLGQKAAGWKRKPGKKGYEANPEPA